ncbi:caspase family protein [Parvicella tangerina]|uniref:Peptidase C14 caspase domain-containing protein n=1 Tax=Parvicella tangerina TaxID=2829795 RepID=A0A916JKU9_9FLAO|nr:caspase family protein [Parvicella tangerina]CAG5078190.1 hypothetical protein CRYO30217_00600 [Parvicella tangerina]
MKRLFILSLSLLLLFLTHAQDGAVFMRINPKGHMSQIRTINVSSDGKYIVSGGFDKTAIKWKTKSGKIEQTFRGEIGIGSEGMIYHSALSPDNKYLALAGWFGADDETEVLGDVRLFDFETGELVRVFKGLGYTPVGIGFSKDGKYIVCGDENSDILKWEVESGKLVDRFDYHSKEYNETLFKLAINNDRMVSIDWRGHVCLWDLNKPGRPIAIDDQFIKEALTNDIGPVAIHPSGEEVLISLNNVIVVLDEKLRYVEYFEKPEGHPGFLKYNQSGSMFLTGIVGSGTNAKPCSVYKKVDGAYVEICQYRGHTNTVLAGDFIDDHHMVTAGGEMEEIHVWKLNDDNTTTFVNELKGEGEPYYSAGKNTEKIGFTNNWSANEGRSVLQKEFDLVTKDVYSIEVDDYRKPRFEWKATRISPISYYTTDDGLEIKEDRTVIDTILRQYWDGSRHNAYTFSDNGYIISGGSYGIITAHNREGVMTNRFVSHEGEIWSCRISNDGKNLVTCGTDKTIRIWPLDKLGIQNPSSPEKSVREVMDELYVPLSEDPYKSIFQMEKITKYADDRTFESWELIINKLKKGDWPCQFLEDRLNFYKSTIIYPTISIYMNDDNEWIIWNHDGYFTSSRNGAKYVGYHVNQGQDKEAKFYPFEQFDLKYNRPDIILKDLDLGYDNLIKYYYKLYQKRLKKHGMTEADLQKEIHAPKLELIDVSKEEGSDWATIRLRAEDSKYSLSKVMVYLNGVPVHGSNGTAANFVKGEQEIDVELVKGTNKFEFSVLNDRGVESLKVYHEMENGEVGERPNLFIVSIGTSKYLESEFNLKYAAKDAQDVVELFKGDAKYEQVYSKILTDEEVTKENIDRLKGFLMGAGRNDVVMVFVAGHGVLDESFNYYYGTHDIDFNDPEKNGVPYEEIEALVEGLRALKKVLIMDTCHSGELDKEDVELAEEQSTEETDVMFRNVGRAVKEKTVGMGNNAQMMKELFVDLRKGTGATVIASSGGAEFSMESDEWKNGLFTYCLINGIKTKEADIDRNGIIHLSEVKSYVQDKVYELSGGRQTPSSRIENLTYDFQVW